MRRFLSDGFASGSGAEAVLAALKNSFAFIEFRPDGTIVDANELFLRALGYQRHEIVGCHHRMFMHPDDAAQAAYREHWARLAAGEAMSGEFMRIARDGTEIWIQASYLPVADRRGRVHRIVKVAADISTTKNRAIDDAGKVAAISRSQAMIEFRPSGEILWANNNFLSTLGYELSEITGEHHRMFVDPAEAQSSAYEDLWNRLRGGDYVAAEFRRIGKNGKEVWIQATYNPIIDPKGRVTKVVKFATEITGRIRATTAVAQGLAAIASGDLTCEIANPFAPEFELLRADFNGSVRTLRDALAKVGGNAAAINSAAGEVSAAADDLSRRTEQQAASVEETAAALEQITATLKGSSLRAADAGKLVSQTQTKATESETVVREAMATMDVIERSSQEIGSIIGVIDEIAFQTNLLALNAGVEAARAGDAGRGFAVVAQEVRGLAQRSAEAAKQIKELITKSGNEVKNGVSLVAKAGSALEAIIGDVKAINANVKAIVEASNEQSTGIAEINTAVTTIDRGTQQNAAMVEETSAASRSLADEAAELNRLLSRFRLGDRPGPAALAGGVVPRAGHDAASPSARSRTAPRPTASRPVTQGALALAQAVETSHDDWEEF